MYCSAKTNPIIMQIKDPYWSMIVTVLQATGQVEESIGQKILRKVGETIFSLLKIWWNTKEKYWSLSIVYCQFDEL